MAERPYQMLKYQNFVRVKAVGWGYRVRKIDQWDRAENCEPAPKIWNMMNEEVGISIVLSPLRM